jgi:uncharacterized lipoprotein YajG
MKTGLLILALMITSTLLSSCATQSTTATSAKTSFSLQQHRP